MNRKAFLSSIAALISIPFLGKSKEKEFTTIEEIAKHYNVSPATIRDFGQSTFINRPITELDEQWVKANPALLYGGMDVAHNSDNHRVINIIKINNTIKIVECLP